ncbi:MAG TPA: Uma2 family endonuclease [Nostocaceae cyanobacterium]|nr:Uma2 family endonuclease [Nostocaceae cyanobacterium]
MVLTPQQFEQLMPDASQLESDEPEMESSLHYTQLLILVTCLEWLWRDRNDYFIGANLTIYYSRQQLKNREFRGPDFFLVKNTEKRHRKSWVVWEEDGKYPNVIIELLSPSTAATDRSLKKDLYENRFHTPEYFWFSPDTLEFVGFHLVGGEYQEIPVNENGWLWSQELGLYLGIESDKLRYFTSECALVPTPEEAALQAKLELEQQTIELQKERQRAEILAERLRSLGIDLD